MRRIYGFGEGEIGRRFHLLRDGNRREQTSFLQVQQADRDERAAESNSPTWLEWHGMRRSSSYESTWGMYFSNQVASGQARGKALGLTPSRKSAVPAGLPIYKTSLPTPPRRAGLSSVVPRGGTGLSWVRAQLMSPGCSTPPTKGPALPSVERGIQIRFALPGPPAATTFGRTRRNWLIALQYWSRIEFHCGEIGLARDCFVIQRFDGGHYDGLYEEVFGPAIRAAGLEPYRVDQDPSASIPIEEIEKRISEATACFAEISEDNPNVWFELGYAIAKEQPLCIVCKTNREKFPFDIQHRLIIRYPLNPKPSDFEKLKGDITERLKAAVAREVTLRKSTDVASALATAPEMNGLQPHELLALTLIYTVSVRPWHKCLEIGPGHGEERIYKACLKSRHNGFTPKGAVDLRGGSDQNGEVVKLWTVSDDGEVWLLKNQHVLNLRTSKGRKQMPVGEITDEDIPF